MNDRNTNDRNPPKARSWTHWITGAALAALVPLSAVPAWATDVSETRTADADAVIDFSGVTGEFRVVGAAADQLSIEGRLGDEVEELVIEGDPSRWTIRVEMKDGERNGWSWDRGPQTALVITVPAGSLVSASSVSGDLEVEGLRGPRLEARTVSGDLILTGNSPTRLTAETVSGDIELDGGGTDSNTVKSVSGDIEAFGLAGSIRAGSVSGDLEIDAVETVEFEGETVSGDLEVALRPVGNARIDVQTHSGGIDLALPAGTPVDVDAKTFSGDLENHFASDTETMREKGMSVRAGDGSVRVRAQTFSGEFVLRESDG
ncbi:DUF4097 family beta strand repeat-containing protein [Halomonas denitrificans]|nr:DUF4097 domain-containing protein [Halomonas denitrificans]